MRSVQVDFGMIVVTWFIVHSHFSVVVVQTILPLKGMLKYKYILLVVEPVAY